MILLNKILIDWNTSQQIFKNKNKKIYCNNNDDDNNSNNTKRKKRRTGYSISLCYFSAGAVITTMYRHQCLRASTCVLSKLSLRPLRHCPWLVCALMCTLRMSLRTLRQYPWNEDALFWPKQNVADNKSLLFWKLLSNFAWNLMKQHFLCACIKLFFSTSVINLWNSVFCNFTGSRTFWHSLNFFHLTGRPF